MSICKLLSINSSSLRQYITSNFSVIFFFVLISSSALAQQATWIWYPGDYSIWLANKMQNHRTERGTFFPPFWRTYSHYNLVEFSKKIESAEPEEVEIAVEGEYNVKLDGKMLTGAPSKVMIGSGRHSLKIKVFNQQLLIKNYLL